MGAVASGDRPAETIDQRVERERLRLLYEAIPGFTLVGSAAVVILVALLWRSAPSGLLLGWLGTHFAVALMRLYSLRAFRRWGDVYRTPRFWYVLFLTGTVAVGLVWGLFALLLFPAASLLERSLLAIGLAAVSVGGAINLSVSRAAGMALLLPMLVPLMGRMLAEGSEASFLIAATLCLFLLVVAAGNRHLAAVLRRSLYLQVRAGDRESRYASLFHHSPLGVFQYDDRSVIIDCNDPFVAVIGASRERILGLNMLRDLEDEALKTAVRGSLAHGKGYYEGDYVSVTGGKTTPVRAHFKGIRDALGRISGGVGIIEDCTEHRRAQQALRESEELLQRTSRVARIGGWQLDLESGELRWTRTTREIHGVGPDFLPTLERSLDFYTNPDDRERLRTAVNDAIEYGRPFDEEGAFESARGERLWVRALGSLEYVDGGTPRLLGIIQDVTERRQAEESVAVRDKVLGRVAENVPGMIYQLRLHGDTGHLSMPYVSGKIREVFGVEPETVRDDASLLFNTVHEDDVAPVQHAVEVSATHLSPFHQQFRVVLPSADQSSIQTEWVEVVSRPTRHEDGGTVWDGFASRITERKALEDQLRRQAFYDPLTHLPNRTLVQDRLEQGLRDARREDRPLVLMYVDLDGFKDINDAWGHGMGDLLLHQVAGRLSGVIRESDTLGRIGGDEFLVVVRESGEREETEALAERLIDSLSAPFELDERPMRITASVGLSRYPEDGDSAEDIMRHADAALYRAKEQGTGQWAWYEPELTRQALARRHLENELRTALDNGQLGVALQPIVSLNGGHIVGYEALARWQHPAEGWISPGRFIPVAESRGMIGTLGEQIYRKALAALSRESYMEPDARLAINIAPRQLQEPAFATQLLAMIRDAGASPERIEIEITEHVFMGDPIEPLRQLRALRKEGVTVSMDDFGTGFSSLSYLRQLPIDRLKIDMIFVRDVYREPDKAAIVNTILALSHEFRLSVVAEGIEVEAEAEHLRRAGCDFGQGFLYGKPVPLVD